MLSVTPRNHTFAVVNSITGKRCVYPYGYRYEIYCRDLIQRDPTIPGQAVIFRVGRMGRPGREWIVSPSSGNIFIATSDEPPENIPDFPPPTNDDIVVGQPTNTVPDWLPIVMWIVLALGIITFIGGVTWFVVA